MEMNKGMHEFIMLLIIQYKALINIFNNNILMQINRFIRNYITYLPFAASGRFVGLPPISSSDPKPFQNTQIALLKEVLHALFQLLSHGSLLVYSRDEALNSQGRTQGQLRVHVDFHPIAEAVRDYG